MFEKDFTLPANVSPVQFTDEMPYGGNWGFTWMGDGVYRFQSNSKQGITSAFRSARAAIKRIEKDRERRRLKVERQEAANEKMREYARRSVSKYLR
jgi:hypothetical protein